MTRPPVSRRDFPERNRQCYILVSRFIKRALTTGVGLIAAIIIVLSVSGVPGACVVMAQSTGGNQGALKFAEQNLFIFTTVEDFEKGETDGTVVIDSGNGAVVLEKGISSGTYTSPVVDTDPFEYMVLSWNADTPRSTYIEILGRVRVLGEWSNWLSWGKWTSSSFVENGKVSLPGSTTGDSKEDSLAKIAIDELIVKGEKGETASAFQYRLVLYASGNGGTDDKVSPKVRLVACTIRNTLPGQSITKLFHEDAPDLSNLDLDVDVPVYSQYTRDPQIAAIMCSPTCMAMVLGYYGIDVSPEEVAWNARDYQTGIFGNWSFNVASVASYGLTSYVDYIVPEAGADPWYTVKQHIAANRPVVVSVRYRKPTYPGNLPPVEGVPINKTDGHLVLVRGFTWKDGVEYVVVNDPAASHNDNVRREYRADQFSDAWVKKVAYIVFEDGEEVEEAYPPIPVAGELIPVGKPEDGYQRFKLQVQDEVIDVSNMNLRSIVVSRDGEKTKPVLLKGRGEGHDLVWLKADSEPGTYTFTFMGKSKDYYQAEIVWPLPKSIKPIYVAAGLIIAAIIAIALKQQKARKSKAAVER